MRRSVLVAIVVGALVGVIAVGSVSLAGSDSSDKTASPGSQNASQASFKSAYAAKRNRGGRHGGRHGGRRHGNALRFGPLAMALSGVADRLGVSKDELIAAGKGVKDRALDRAVSDGTITQAERAALEECMKTHGQRRERGQRGANCDRRVARRAHRKLEREFRQRLRNDRDGLKKQLVADLAAELGKDPSEVEDALRAELVELLDTGVKLGLVSEDARKLALGCWDDPNGCDLKALRREVKRSHGRGRRP